MSSRLVAEMSLLRYEFPLGVMGSVGMLVLISQPELRQEGWKRGECRQRHQSWDKQWKRFCIFGFCG